VEYTVALLILVAEDMFLSHWSLTALGAIRIYSRFVQVRSLMGRLGPKRGVLETIRSLDCEW
jgi:hypothetical protein